MIHLLSLIEAKRFTIATMTKHVNLFGGPRKVEHKISLLRFEIKQLENKLDTLH